MTWKARPRGLPAGAPRTKFSRGPGPRRPGEAAATASYGGETAGAGQGRGEVRTMSWNWINVAAGIWLILAPYPLGFSGTINALWNSVILGAIVAIVAGVALYQEHEKGTAEMPHGTKAHH